MTNPPTSEDPRNGQLGDDQLDDERPSGGDPHTCYNCFAEFSWEPTIHDGEDFCCAGCVEGGPCICTYDRPPQPTEVELTPTAVVSEPAKDDDDEDVDDDDIELIAHREILLEAIEELPVQLQEIARLRVVIDAPLEELARDADVTPSDAAAMVHQAQALLGRTLGPEFVIEYIPAGVRTPRTITPPTVETPVVEVEPTPPHRRHFLVQPQPSKPIFQLPSVLHSKR
jgi:hypothetical protein